MEITDVSINCAHDKIVPIHEIVPNPRNPNLHSPEQVAWIAKVIQHRGWRAPVIISTRSGFVVCGHGRIQAAMQLGLEGVPVDFQDFESEADEWAHMVADNALAEMSAMAEDDLLELARQKTGLVPMAEAKEAIRKVLEPLRSLLDALPKAVAIQANPSDPVLAEEAIRDGLHKVYEMMQEHREKLEKSEASTKQH